MMGITDSELRKRCTRDELWVSVHGKVYDLTSFITDHPGGGEVLDDCAGTNGTEVFEYAGHGDHHIQKLQPYIIGIQEQNGKDEEASQHWRVTNAISEDIRSTIPAKTPSLLLMAAVVVFAATIPFVSLNVPSWLSQNSPVESTSTSNAKMLLLGLGGLSLNLVALGALYMKIQGTWTHSVEVFDYPAFIPAKRVS